MTDSTLFQFIVCALFVENDPSRGACQMSFALPTSRTLRSKYCHGGPCDVRHLDCEGRDQTVGIQYGFGGLLPQRFKGKLSYDICFCLL